jgi:drug/metabolite transporter (DMT)-like permease
MATLRESNCFAIFAHVMNQPAAPVTRRAELALLALALIWGTSHVFTKNILTAHTPFFYNSLRFGIASLCFGLLLSRHLRQASAREIRQGILLGLCSFVGIICYSVGLIYTAASKAGFITGLYLVFTPLVAFALFRARPAIDNLIGLIVAVLGFGILSYPQGGATFNQGDGLILCAALAWAFHIAATSHFAQQSDVKTLAAAQVITVTLLSFATYFLLRTVTNWPAPLGQLPSLEARTNIWQTSTLIQIVYMALVVTFAAALLQTWAQGKVTAAYAVLLYALEPVTAALFAWAALGEQLSVRSITGATLIVLGVFISRLNLWQRLTGNEDSITLSHAQ